jgi:hypothetical protein
MVASGFGQEGVDQGCDPGAGGLRHRRTDSQYDPDDGVDGSEGEMGGAVTVALADAASDGLGNGLETRHDGLQ